MVITNLDDASPTFLRHGETVFDIRSLEVLPTDPAHLAEVGVERTRRCA